MSSNTSKRKIKEKQNSNSFQSSKIKTRSSTCFEETNKKKPRKAQSCCADFTNEQSIHAEDKEVMQVFKRHATSKVDAATLQNMNKFDGNGWCRILLKLENKITLLYYNLVFSIYFQYFKVI